ncbi:unnamed protein product, partial [Sphacelaria rigidula]
EERGGRYTCLIVDELEKSRLADRHAVVLIGDQEICRGRVPGRSPFHEGSQRAHGSCAATAAAAASDAAGLSSAGEGGCEFAFAKHGADPDTKNACGRWCTLENFFRRLTAPLHQAKRTRSPRA